MGGPLEILFVDAERHLSKKGSILIQPDVTPPGVHFLYRGYVKAYDITNAGECQLITIAGPGEIFPTHWTLPMGQQQLFYEAMGNVEYSIVPLEVFDQLAEKNITILWAQLHTLLDSYQTYEQRIQNLEYKSARAKLAFHLLFLGDHFGHVSEHYTYIDVPVTYQDLADAVNLTRETANRLMRKLISEGIIKRDRRQFVIINRQRLRRELGSSTTLTNN